MSLRLLAAKIPIEYHHLLLLLLMGITLELYAAGLAVVAWPINNLSIIYSEPAFGFGQRHLLCVRELILTSSDSWLSDWLTDTHPEAPKFGPSWSHHGTKRRRRPRSHVWVCDRVKAKKLLKVFATRNSIYNRGGTNAHRVWLRPGWELCRAYPVITWN